VFRIGGNTFYDRKNKIPMKILEFKRSGIGLFAKFHGILNGFPNQDCQHFCRVSSTELTWYHYGLTKEVVAIANTIVILQQHYQQQNPIKATIGLTIKEVKEHGGSNVLWSNSFALFFAGMS
jgi:hypothetical protein